MASPQTEIEIQSNISIVLGAGEITDLSSKGAFGVDLQSAYDLLLDAEVGTNRWRFDAKIQQLSLVGALATPFDQWNYEYLLPADYSSLQRIYPYAPFEIFGKSVYMGSSATYLAEYYSNNPAVTLWSGPFKAYFVLKVAYYLAVSTAENAQLAEQIEKRMLRAESDALFASASSRPNQKLKSRPYLAVRN